MYRCAEQSARVEKWKLTKDSLKHLSTCEKNEFQAFSNAGLRNEIKRGQPQITFSTSWGAISWMRATSCLHEASNGLTSGGKHSRTYRKKMIKHHTNRNQNSLWCAVRAHNWSQIKRKRARHIQKLCTLDLCVSSKRMGTSIWYFARVSKHRLQRSLALSHQNSSRGDLPVIEPLPA